jgi:hypothetical protein
VECLAVNQSLFVWHCDTEGTVSVGGSSPQQPVVRHRRRSICVWYVTFVCAFRVWTEFTEPTGKRSEHPRVIPMLTVVMVVVGQSPSPGKQSVASSHARPFLFCSVTTSQFRSVATWQAEVHGSIRISQLTSPGS